MAPSPMIISRTKTHLDLAADTEGMHRVDLALGTHSVHTQHTPDADADADAAGWPGMAESQADLKVSGL